MPSFHESNGYTFRIIPGDHGHPHAHIEGQGGTLKIWFTRSEVTRALVVGKIPKKMQGKLIREMETNLDKASDLWDSYCKGLG